MVPNRPYFCKRCGVSPGVADVVVKHSPADPLQVSECDRCGAILDIGGHQW